MANFLLLMRLRSFVIDDYCGREVAQFDAEQHRGTVSLPPGTFLPAAEDLIHSGFVEIVLTGEISDGFPFAIKGLLRLLRG